MKNIHTSLIPAVSAAENLDRIFEILNRSTSLGALETRLNFGDNRREMEIANGTLIVLSSPGVYGEIVGAAGIVTNDGVANILFRFVEDSYIDMHGEMYSALFKAIAECAEKEKLDLAILPVPVDAAFSHQHNYYKQFSDQHHRLPMPFGVDVVHYQIPTEVLATLQ